MSARAFAVTLGVLALIGLLGFGLLSKATPALEAGERAPDAELPTLDGEGTGSLAEYRGQWVLVNFWASWCIPCRTESPDLERYHQRHSGENFTVLGINQRDLSGDATKFIGEYGLSYPQLRDAKGERADPWGMTGLPESFLVDPDGHVALIRRGPVDEEYLEKNVTPLIEGREEGRGS